MQAVAKLCILGAAIAFVIAVIQALFLGPIMHVPAESFSRASTNLALVGIGCWLMFRSENRAT